MAMIKCKMCGGDLLPDMGCTVAECEYCGSRQTVPKADDEKKMTLFARANRLRTACEFDKAAGIYESIVADFPGEAEAYWGLVLCKYGIEYVDDPATGKKIPTCHRSGFDSVLEDANYGQALENADLTAQLVYQEEAGQLEQLRKEIVSVSSGEKPYDIFICYKETDQNGSRTLDSVLAQDLYTALTDKGYRVFFSRITLQGKLGQAYEPYIFAALNSARVMLAVGTSYEHYTAVWVKNEWSRYLKLMAQDKSKHLIPCYKDLDPEDIPSQFNHLQGADLGKMGAIQDILFNMEKYIPLQKATVVREQVIVNEVSSQKIVNLLDRGRMALEDGDFANADGFFEEVLNNNSKHARAYLGKFLANQRCASLAAYEAKSLQQANSAGQTYYRLDPDEAHINRIIEYYGKSFADKYNLRKLYRFELQYMSRVPQLLKIEKAELLRWDTDKNLTKAVQFADPDFAAELAQSKSRISEGFRQAINEANAQEKGAVEDLQSRYALHLDTVDKQAAARHTEEQAALEQRYTELLAKKEAETSQRGLRNLAEDFDKLGSFRDSRDLAAACRDSALDMDYQAGLTKMQHATSERDFLNAGQYFAKLLDYKDCPALAQQCKERAQEVRRQVEWQQEQEKQQREKLAAANRSLAKKVLLIFLLAGIALFVVGIWGMYTDMTGSGVEKIGGIIGSIMLQTLVFILPTVCFLVQVLLRGRKDKVANAFMILSFIVSGFGILIWGIVSIVFGVTSGSDSMLVWSLSALLFNGLCMYLSFVRKRKI